MLNPLKSRNSIKNFNISISNTCNDEHTKQIEQPQKK